MRRAMIWRRRLSEPIWTPAAPSSPAAVFGCRTISQRYSFVLDLRSKESGLQARLVVPLKRRLSCRSTLERMAAAPECLRNGHLQRDVARSLESAVVERSRRESRYRIRHGPDHAVGMFRVG